MKRCYASAAANIETPPALRDSRSHFGTIGPHFTPPPLLPPPQYVSVLYRAVGAKSRSFFPLLGGGANVPT